MKSATGYDVKLDKERLGKQLGRVRYWMLFWGTSGSWFTLQEISHELLYPEASISARLRDLRRLGYVVDKRRRGEPKAGCWEYRVSKPLLDNRVGELFPATATQERA